MTNEEKILEMLGTMQEDLARVNDRLGRLETAQDKMQEDITRINVTLEVKIAKEIQHLADGHMGIVEQLHKLDDIEKKLEDVSIRADSAHAAAVVNEYEITQLKQVR